MNIISKKNLVSFYLSLFCLQGTILAQQSDQISPCEQSNVVLIKTPRGLSYSSLTIRVAPQWFELNGTRFSFNIEQSLWCSGKSKCFHEGEEIPVVNNKNKLISILSFSNRGSFRYATLLNVNSQGEKINFDQKGVKQVQFAARNLKDKDGWMKLVSVEFVSYDEDEFGNEKDLGVIDVNHSSPTNDNQTLHKDFSKTTNEKPLSIGFKKEQNIDVNCAQGVVVDGEDDESDKSENASVEDTTAVNNEQESQDKTPLKDKKVIKAISIGGGLFNKLRRK